MKWNHFSLEYSLVAIVSLNFQIFLSHIFSSWAHSKRFYASTNSSPLNKRSLDITRNITYEQYLLEHTCFIYIYIKHSFRMQQIHVDTLAEWHQFSLDNAAFQSIPYKIILHRFAIILMSVVSSRTEHSKKYQKPCRSICNVPMFAAYRIRRNNGNRKEKKRERKV